MISCLLSSSLSSIIVMSEHEMKDALTKVAALVKSEEFKKASTEFVAKHCGAFGFDDENKLEYTAIHEE